MPGYLLEKLGVTETLPQPDSSHFRLLRLAILRGLSCEQLSETTFRVSSSRPNHPPYIVDVAKGCPCDSALPCSHFAMALDRWHEREAGIQTKLDYFSARRLDFGSLHVRELHSTDRRFGKVCVERVREKYSHLFVTVEREAVEF